MNFNTFRDRLLVRLLSQPSRNAIFDVVNYSLEDELKHLATCDGPEHIALPLAHLADLMDDKPQWKAEVQEILSEA